MVLALPPIRSIKYDEQTEKLVYDGLTSVIAGHPQAVATYTFYEELDAWLGPWGTRGYPIAYGKFYNVAFTTNEKLMADPVAKQWVWDTTILLQEALRAYVMTRMRAKTLGAITEPELRKAAFDSHPKAYTQGGLTRVVMIAPELLPIIALIPAKEFDPTGPNFKATVLQVVLTAGLVMPQMPGYILPAMAGPAHTGIFPIAVRRDEQQLLMEQRLGATLKFLELSIKSGDLDDIPTLTAIIAGLNAREFPDQGFAREAREVVMTAEQRRKTLQTYYDNLLSASPEIERRFHERFGSLLAPSPPRFTW